MQGYERDVWFETACSTYSHWYYMAADEHIERNCSVLPVSWVSEVCARVQGGGWGHRPGWRAQGLAQHEKMGVLLAGKVGLGLVFFWRALEPQGMQSSGMDGVAKPALKMYWFVCLT